MRPLIVMVLICDLPICGGWIFSQVCLAGRGFGGGPTRAGDQRPQHDFEIPQEGVGRLHRRDRRIWCR